MGCSKKALSQRERVAPKGSGVGERRTFPPHPSRLRRATFSSRRRLFCCILFTGTPSFVRFREEQARSPTNRCGCCHFISLLSGRLPRQCAHWCAMTPCWVGMTYFFLHFVFRFCSGTLRSGRNQFRPYRGVLLLSAFVLLTGGLPRRCTPRNDSDLAPAMTGLIVNFQALSTASSAGYRIPRP